MSKIGRGIIKRGNVFWYRAQRDGKRLQISLQTGDEKTAIERAATIKTSGALETKNDLTSEIAAFLSDKASLGKHTERSTQWFRETLLPFGKFVGNKPSATITEKEVEAFYKQMRKTLAETTVKSRMGALRSFFAWSVRTRRRFDNPTKEIKNHRISQPARTVFATKAQRDAIIAAARKDVELSFMLLCAFHAGMRFNEISEARGNWFTVTGESGFVHVQRTETFVPKNKRNRTVPLTKTFRRFLVKHKIPARPGFVLRDDKVRTHKYRVNFRHPWNAHMKKCGFKFSPHVGRHTFASLLAQKGKSMFHIAEWIGDTLEVTMKHYAHLAPQDKSIDLID